MVITSEKVGCGFSLVTARQQRVFRASRSDEGSAWQQARIRRFVDAKRSDLRNGLTRRQRTFVLEKLVGLNDKDAYWTSSFVRFEGGCNCELKFRYLSHRKRIENAGFHRPGLLTACHSVGPEHLWYEALLRRPDRT